MTPADVIAWRKQERSRLIAARVQVPEETRNAWTAQIADLLEPIALATDGPISFYWPFRGEPNLRPLMRRLAAMGKEIALPAVVQARHPLEFRPWTPSCPMAPGVWNIPIPDTDVRVVPRLLLAPVVGFDSAGYRLGYGGGFFDRTLASLKTPRTVIGLGYDCQAIETVRPLQHDIKMDRIVTESGFKDARADAEFASAACALAEAPDAYAGYLDPAEIAAELQAIRAAGRDAGLIAAIDKVLRRLPRIEAVHVAAGSLADRLARLRARVRDDGLHAAIGEALTIAQRMERS